MVANGTAGCLMIVESHGVRVIYVMIVTNLKVKIRI